MTVPIYHSVCDDLKVYPQAMKVRGHEQFMREHDCGPGWIDTVWYAEPTRVAAVPVDGAWNPEPAPTRVAGRRRVRPPRPRHG